MQTFFLIMRDLNSILDIIKYRIASDVAQHNQFIPPANLKSQQYLDNLSEWTDINLMKLNVKKSKYMTVNFTKNYQFSTRLCLDGNNLEEV